MTHRILLIAGAIVAGAAMSACSDSTSPNQAAPGQSAAPFPRSGVLRVTKACGGTYNGLAGDYCTITSSNIKEIEVGARITYATAVSAVGFLDTDVVLDMPGPGNNAAFGRCRVDLTAINGTMGCVFSGGTGKFTHFFADVKLSLVDPNRADTDLVWNGTYSFRPGN